MKVQLQLQLQLQDELLLRKIKEQDGFAREYGASTWRQDACITV